jgi:16S rRNA (uracil1498-N3)-methyltransferase
MEATKNTMAQIKPGMKIGVFIGPEGGIDDSEIDLAIDNNIKQVSLGKRILRTETAGIAALSIIMYKLEEEGIQG